MNCKPEYSQDGFLWKGVLKSVEGIKSELALVMELVSGFMKSSFCGEDIGREAMDRRYAREIKENPQVWTFQVQEI